MQSKGIIKPLSPRAVKAFRRFFPLIPVREAAGGAVAMGNIPAPQIRYVANGGELCRTGRYDPGQAGRPAGSLAVSWPDSVRRPMRLSPPLTTAAT